MPKSDDLQKVGICLPADVLARLDQFADEEGRSRSNAVARLIEDALKAADERKRAS